MDSVQASPDRSWRYLCRTPVERSDRDIEDKLTRKEEKRRVKGWAAKELRLPSSSPVSSSLAGPSRCRSPSPFNLPVHAPMVFTLAKAFNAVDWTVVSRRRKAATSSRAGSARRPAALTSATRMQLTLPATRRHLASPVMRSSSTFSNHANHGANVFSNFNLSGPTRHKALCGPRPAFGDQTDHKGQSGHPSFNDTSQRRKSKSFSLRRLLGLR